MTKRTIALTAMLALFGYTLRAQSSDDLLNLLTRKGTITQAEADSLREAYAIKEQRTDSFPLKLGRSLDLSGYTQANYLNYQRSGLTNGFAVKRARLDFQGHFSSRFDYRLLVDFAGYSAASGTAPTGGALIQPTLLDANLTYKPFTWLNVKVGQMLEQFSLESLTQDRYLDLIERSQVVNALVARKGDASNGLVDSIGNQNGRDLGVQLNGSLFRKSDYYVLDYYVQLLDGAGINSLDNNNEKDVDARLVVRPFKKLAVGGSYYNGFDKFTSSTGRSQERIRWGADAAWVERLFSLKGEYIRGQEGNENPVVHQGWYAQGTYFVLPRKLQAVVRYDTYDANVNAKADQTTPYWDLGLNYFFNVWTKVEVYYSIRGQQTIHDANNLFEAQFQIGF